MAWLDDRVWCHPKFADLSHHAFRIYVHGVAYSTGFGTKGVLTAGQQLTIGSTPKTRRELVAVNLWNELGEGSIGINDWDYHNSKRDARREADRLRKRAARSAGQSTGTSAGQSTRKVAAEGSDGSEDRSSALGQRLRIADQIDQSLRSVS